MKEYSVEIDIKSRPERIWEVLINGGDWPSWEPATIRIEGKIQKNEKIKVFTKLSPDRAFPVKVSEFEPGKKMVWTGGMPLGLFKGVRTFNLTKKVNGVSFSMREVFSGPLSSMITKKMPDMTENFENFAASLKREVESREE